MAYATVYTDLINQTKVADDNPLWQENDTKHNMQTITLVRLFEEYVRLYTGNHISLGEHKEQIGEDNYKRFEALQYVVKNKDPREYFNALFQCYNLYTYYKSKRMPDLTKLLDDKVLSSWTYMIVTNGSESTIHLPSHLEGADDPVINAYKCLYDLNDPNHNFDTLWEEMFRQVTKDEDIEFLKELLNLELKYPMDYVERYFCNVLEYKYRNLQDYQKYLRGFDLKELDYKSRGKIVSVGSYLGYLNDYRSLKQLDFAIDKDGQYLWKNK